MEQRKILVASDVPLYAESISQVLSGHIRMSVAVAHCICEGSVADLAEEDAEGILIDCAGPQNWGQLAALCREAAPQPVILLARHVAMETVCQAREAGLRAVIDLREKVEQVVELICRALEGEAIFPASEEEATRGSRRIRLTRREGQLVELLAEGLKNKEIAAQLNLSEGTVKVYLSKLFQKVGAKDRYELALFGLRNLVNGEFGLIEPAGRRKPARSVREPERTRLRTLVVGNGSRAAWVAKAGTAG